MYTPVGPAAPKIAIFKHSPHLGATWRGPTGAQSAHLAGH